MDESRCSPEASSKPTTEAMAQLLLSGWAMMAENCSECHDVPLMRSSQGVLKCCRCNKESRPGVLCYLLFLSSLSCKACDEEVRSSNVADRHKYRIVNECGLDSSVMTGIHGADGDRVLPKTLVVGRTPSSTKADGRRLQQLCLLRLELNKALDREVNVLDQLERTLRLLDIVESKL
ncbi:uncharacterized protein BXIN_1984 [Babesia sp. Xinjiang]|uniref:uncharacterized protein n=1 Tax=Babesia sp. Xinjiang TaxID=462227 RepID=UPI000A234CCB|nr:uncharacterized protein BXIN_1984 [Babesia sp. Xinjiang]ORM40357.1 hypothetical protein BXIN_1984 [Babesia sp. Xinjiang]